MKSKPKLINENLLTKDNNATDMLNKRHFYIICLFLVVATLAVYWQVLDNDFVNYDDAKAHDNLGYAYVLSNDRDSALEQYKILKSINTELANRLFNLINQ